jgi:hypothetical protein
MQAAREDSGHGAKPTSIMCENLPMTGSYLVARLHVDLQRVASAVCSAL